MTEYHVRIDGDPWVILAGGARSHTFENPVNDTEYTFSVRASIDVGEGAASTVMAIPVMDDPVINDPDTVPAPTNLRVENGAQNAQNVWEVDDLYHVDLQWDIADEDYGHRVTKYRQRPGHICPNGADPPLGSQQHTPGDCALLRQYHEYGARWNRCRDDQVRGGETGNIYVFRVHSLGERDDQNEYGLVGAYAEITVLVPTEDAYVPRAPTGFSFTAEVHRGRGRISMDWDTQRDIADESRAYVIQWRKSDEQYDDSPTGDRTHINPCNGPLMFDADGQFYFNYAKSSLQATPVDFSATYHARVGNCLDTDCTLADVVWASERSARVPANPQ